MQQGLGMTLTLIYFSLDRRTPIASSFKSTYIQLFYNTPPKIDIAWHNTLMKHSINWNKLFWNMEMKLCNANQLNEI